MYEFGPFRADTIRRVLSRDGLPVPLTGKCFEILSALLRRAPETVSKDELMKDDDLPEGYGDDEAPKPAKKAKAKKAD